MTRNEGDVVVMVVVMTTSRERDARVVKFSETKKTGLLWGALPWTDVRNTEEEKKIHKGKEAR